MGLEMVDQCTLADKEKNMMELLFTDSSEFVVDELQARLSDLMEVDKTYDADPSAEVGLEMVDLDFKGQTE